MRLLLWGLRLGAICLALSVVLGFAGGIHPVFDSLSLLRVPLALLCLLILVFPMGARLRLTLGGAALVGLVSTVPLFFGGATQEGLRVYSKNLWYRNAEVNALAADIRDSGADVVTLQEVSTRNRSLLTTLAADYPHQHLCTYSGWNGIAVLSRTAIADTACSTRRAVAAAQVQTAQGPVWVASVHLNWPFPYSNATSAQKAVDLIAGLDGPVVMAGDFNIFPWASTVRDMRAAAGLETAQPIRPTYNLEGLPLLLDHVHAPGGGTASYRGLFGSDHIGVLADVALTR